MTPHRRWRDTCSATCAGDSLVFPSLCRFLASSPSPILFFSSFIFIYLFLSFFFILLSSITMTHHTVLACVVVFTHVFFFFYSFCFVIFLQSLLLFCPFFPCLPYIDTLDLRVSYDVTRMLYKYLATTAILNRLRHLKRIKCNKHSQRKKKNFIK